MPLLNAVVTFPTVFLQVLMACVHKNVKLCTFPKVWCKSNFTHFGTEFAVKHVGSYNDLVTVMQINCVIRECVICVVFIILISEGVKVLTSMLVAIMTWLQ